MSGDKIESGEGKVDSMSDIYRVSQSIVIVILPVQSETSYWHTRPNKEEDYMYRETYSRAKLAYEDLLINTDI